MYEYKFLFIYSLFHMSEGMQDDTLGAVLLDKHVQNVAPEGGYLKVVQDDKVVAGKFGTDKVFHQKQQKPATTAYPAYQKHEDHYIPLNDNNGFGTNAAFTGKHDGEGTSIKDKARFEQLKSFFNEASDMSKEALHPPKVHHTPSKEASSSKHTGFGYSAKLHKGAHLSKMAKVAYHEKKAPTQMLSQQYLEFGQKAR